MPVFISMLRGVNVGGHNKIGMEELRALFGSLGFSGAQTLIQSGNVVFRASERNAARVAERVEDGISSRFGFRPPVIVRNVPEMKKALAGNPFPAEAADEPGKLIVLFLGALPDEAARRKALEVKRGAEQLRFQGRELFVYYPDGQGKSKLAIAALERALGTTMTGRNWNTVNKLLDMAVAIEAA
ncbi:MAG TPA: DUF1697 domain-containing protein [Bryobacteraceae bacterium]|nr:DUF1697 domain-containing protein [Bryobacteraceae bacterium]